MEIPSTVRPNTLHGLAQAIVAVPYQIGYYPTASLVALCMQAGQMAASAPIQRGQVVLTARVDLSGPQEQEQVLAAIEPALARADTRMVVFIAFEQGRGDPCNTSELLGQATALAHSHGAVVMAAARVRGRRWHLVTNPESARSADASGLAGCAQAREPDGRWQDLPAAEDVPMVAEYVLAGRSPAPDRRSVEGLLRPTCPELARSVAQLHLETTVSARAEQMGTQETRLRAAQLLSVLINGGVEQSEPSGLDAVDLVATIDALDDLRFRDSVLSAIIPCSTDSDDLVDAEMTRMVSAAMPHPITIDTLACVRLAQAAAYVPAERSAPWLSLVGYLAWQIGEGALANVAIAAARAADPRYSLARLVDMALSAAVAPPRPV
ncbi:MAG: DUF4192 family protein [Ornithinimicrobium sp.]